VTTVVAFVSALIHGRVETAPDFVPKEVFQPAGFIFLIALMGWMPTAVDISTWTSLWAEAKIKESGHRPTLKESLFDFNFGYLVTAFLAICFLTLGSMIVYGTGTELSNSSPIFAGQIIAMFTEAIGNWSYYIIAIAALSTMFSTTIAVIDGYGRAISRTIQLLFMPGARARRQYNIWIVIVSVGGYFIVASFLNNLKALVDLAAIVSFVVAPLAAYLNYKVIFDKGIREEFRPPKWLHLLAVAGLIFLSLFTIIYFFVLFNPEGVSSFMERF